MEYAFWLGASAEADPALVASDQAPTGFDPLRCDLEDDWEDHCGDLNCDICPPFDRPSPSEWR